LIKLFIQTGFDLNFILSFLVSNRDGV